MAVAFPAISGDKCRERCQSCPNDRDRIYPPRKPRRPITRSVLFKNATGIHHGLTKKVGIVSSLKRRVAVSDNSSLESDVRLLTEFWRSLNMSCWRHREANHAIVPRRASHKYRQCRLVKWRSQRSPQIRSATTRTAALSSSPCHSVRGLQIMKLFS